MKSFIIVLTLFGNNLCILSLIVFSSFQKALSKRSFGQTYLGGTKGKVISQEALVILPNDV